MEDLEDELDLRYHKGLEPDVYYRCPTLESLHDALRNELAKSASTTLIPTAIVTEFILANASTLTIPVTQQTNLDALIEPADFAQTITAEHALCCAFESKDRLKPQRAIARSIIDAIEHADGFKYKERSVSNTKSGDGARFRYVCRNSPQSLPRRKKSQESEESDGDATAKDARPTYDCGGAIHIKFSIKRQAINVVYKHNPIHTHAEEMDSVPAVPTTNGANHQPPAADATTNGSKKRKRTNKQKEPVAVMDEYHEPDMNMSTSREAPQSSIKSSRKKNGVSAPTDSPRKTSSKKGSRPKEVVSPSTSRKRAAQTASVPPARLSRNKACLRCREKKIKCNEATPSCNQCQRGLWTCQYMAVGNSKRSKNGCINCKQRGRKCTEEKPSCAYCLRIDDDCAYAEYS
ncbi:hypothetical protein LEMA_P105670.1 [Plenodomus lingam JN3]|uniref:Zn(2)-C6 fungal-type domain-containing protein n=2 Tax=Leptosphaeria maculans TaxID=5022 RepID=E5A1H2_LEPMJ|nr:hypothetical protein LEMA_P105670.1 [Plenodomus lingam JN3]CBX97436.1 hypothetical protein LEMA_P105670.1 [Plenodomus lingam JN3]